MSLLRPPINSSDDQDETDATQNHLPQSSESVNEVTTASEQAPETYPRRIPNLAHALLFVSFAFLLLLLAQLVLIKFRLSPIPSPSGAVTLEHPKLQLIAQAIPYLFTLIASWFFFPKLWRRSFVDGISWHWPTARDQARKLLGVGLALGGMSSLVDFFVTPPKTLLLDNFFLKQSDAWVITLFGIFVAPVFEEICFRGFLVPAFAIAYDWLSLPRTPADRLRWQTTTALTPVSLIFSAILTSILFALLHGQQVGYAWSAMAVLFIVSLALTFVRVKTQSVAASAVVHAAYNSLLFLMTILATGGYRHLDRLTK